MGSEPEVYLGSEGGGDLGGMVSGLGKGGDLETDGGGGWGPEVLGVGGSAGWCESVELGLSAGDDGRWGFSAGRARRRLQRWNGRSVSAGGGRGAGAGC